MCFKLLRYVLAQALGPSRPGWAQAYGPRPKPKPGPNPSRAWAPTNNKTLWWFH